MMRGPLKGAMMKMTPLGSALCLGPIAQKLRLNSAFWGAVHLSTES